MSLARLAMRIAAARALRGATLAEERVHDSAIAPIDQTIAEERQAVDFRELGVLRVSGRQRDKCH